MAGRLDGKIAVITGGCSGIGLGTVDLFVAEGAQVVAADIQDEKGAMLEARFPGKVRYAHCDVTQEADIAAALKLAGDAFGGLDILFNNAGIGSFAAVPDLAPEEWRRVIATDLDSVYYGCRAVIPLMRAQGGGAIVNITSIAGHRGFQDHLCYAASKAGLEGATRVMAKELGPHGIRVNAVAPTITLTELAAEAWSDPEKSAPMMVRHPLNRFAEADEVAQSIALLLSDDSAMITGAILPVDGGFLAV